MTVVLSLTSIMRVALDEFWRYEGSRTTPPCTEHAIWSIFRTPIILLDYQLNSFRHDFFYESYHGPQPLYLQKSLQIFQR